MRIGGQKYVKAGSVGVEFVEDKLNLLPYGMYRWSTLKNEIIACCEKSGILYGLVVFRSKTSGNLVYGWQRKVQYDESTRVSVGGCTIRTYRACAHILGMIDIADPKQEIDHINCDRLDNRPCNLRRATRSQQMQYVFRQKTRL